MKIKVIILLTLVTMVQTTMAAEPVTDHTEKAVDAVRNMGVGWNLGNTLDANTNTITNVEASTYWGGQGLESETTWGQPFTQAALFTMMRNAGFGAIRVPVTWYNHMDSEGKVNQAWMQRVHEVVDFVLDNGLYCILNVHHDTGADSETSCSWIKADAAAFLKNKARYEGLWTQIAEEFRDYDQRLLFEGYNEMVDSYSSWCFASFACSGNYNEKVATSAYSGLNSYAQSFVNTVRATGGNNATRNLIVNTYAAACGTGTWNKHLQDPLIQMALPKDEAQDHLIFEVHTYPNLTNNGTNKSLQTIRSEVDDLISKLEKYLIVKGAPVIIGEWGTSNVDAGAGKTDYDVRPALMKSFMEYFVQQCKAHGIGTFYWMGMSDSQYRSLPAFSQPDLAECITKAYHGKDFIGQYPELEAMGEVLCFEGDKLIGWGDGISIHSFIFDAFSEKPELILTYSQAEAYDVLQFYLRDWSSKTSVIVNEKIYAGDFRPSTHYGSTNGSEHTTTISFDDTTYQNIRSKGLIIHGSGIRLTRVELRIPGYSAIHDLPLTDAIPAIYNLAGQQVQSCSRGIYIVGRKMIYNK